MSTACNGIRRVGASGMPVGDAPDVQPRTSLLAALAGAAVSLSITSARGDSVQDQLDAQRNLNAVQIVYRDGVPHTDPNGRPMMAYEKARSFFPIGMWGNPRSGAVDGHDYDWQALEEAGFNTVWPWNVRIGPALADAEKHDVQVIVMGEITDEDLAAYRDHPRLLGNQVREEPTGSLWGKPAMQTSYDAFLAYKEKANAVAPALRVFALDVAWIMEPATSWWTKWNTAGDVTAHDNYPIAARGPRTPSIGAEPNGIPQSVALAAAANQEGKPVWIVLGAFEMRSEGSIGSFAFRFPTPIQLRALVYASLIHGATGIHYFIWDSYISRDGSVIGMSPDPRVAYAPVPRAPNKTRPSPASPMQLAQSRGLWAAASHINRELAQLAPALLSPTVGVDFDYTVKVEGKGVTATPIRCLLKPHPDGGYVLLSVNVDDALLKVTFTFPGKIQETSVLHENRQPATPGEDGRSFSLNYEPFDTHVVRVQMK